jgi:GNAT superfamily N-acetyltransferase
MAGESTLPAGDCPCGQPAISVLPDGAAVLIRAVVPEDAARLERMFYRLSSNSIYFWRFIPAPHQPYWAAQMGALARVDYADQYALVALVGGEIVGIARYDRGASPEEAEFAIVIEDAWQRRGLGRRLMTRLIAEASQHQVSVFMARILGENRRALRLVAALFAQIQPQWVSGECQVRSPLASLRPAG